MDERNRDVFNNRADLGWAKLFLEDLEMPALLKSCGAMVLAVLVVLAGTTRIGAQIAVLPSSPVPAPSKSQKPATTLPKSCALPGISPQQLHEVVDASNTLQPPLAADAMIRIAAKVAAQCPALAKDLLQRAFDQADRVEPDTAYKLASGMGLSTDSRISFADKTYSLRMDRLSLQSRAVLGMAPLDAKKAIQLFQRVHTPNPTAASCADAFAPDVAIYYDALGKVFALLREQKPQTDAAVQAPFLQLREVTGATTSPVQLAPLAKVLDEANLDSSDLASLLSTLAAAVESFPIDDNSFFSRSQYPAVKAKAQLVELASNKQVSAAAFAHAFHDYLDRSLNGAHCEENEPTDLKELVILYQSFNRGPAASDQGNELLSIPTSLPSIEPHPDAGEYWQTAKGKALLMDGKHVNFDDNWRPYTDAERKTPEWQDRVRHLLDEMDNWDASEEPDASTYYHEREILIYRVLADIPPGTLYDRVISVWVKTFAESSLQWDNPTEWYIGVSDFLRYSKKNVNGPASAAAIAPLKDSSNPYLHSIGILAEFVQ